MKNENVSRRRRNALLISYFGGYLFLFQSIILGLIYQKFGYTGFVISEALANAGMLILFSFVMCDWFKQQWERFAEHLAANLWKVFENVVLLLAITILFDLFIASPMHLQEAENQVNNEMLMGMNLIGFLLDAIITAPFVEEMIFRGCIYEPVKRKHGFLMGALVSALLFGGMHVMASIVSGNWLNLLYIIDYGLCGFVLCLACRRSDSVWAAVFTHAAFNLIGICAML